MDFFLFRLKAYRQKDSDLKATRREFFFDLLQRKPGGELRVGYQWHIGNIKRIDQNSIYFAVGRTTKASSEKYDEDAGNFVQTTGSESPFTHVLVDEELGLIAIAARTKLSPTPKGIANSLQKILNTHVFTVSHRVRFEIAEIIDPKGFIRDIKNAYEIVSYRMHFTEPNPFDVEKDFHQPMEKLLLETGGKKGETRIQGGDLDKEVIEELTKSVASTGNEASASIRDNKGERPRTKKLEGTPVRVHAPETISETMLARVLKQMREAYEQVRG